MRWNFIQLYTNDRFTLMSFKTTKWRQGIFDYFYFFEFSMWWETKKKKREKKKSTFSVCFVLFLGTFTRFSFHLWISFEKTSKRVNFRLLLLFSTRKKQNIFYVIRLHSEQIASYHYTTIELSHNFKNGNFKKK